jgi:hypothetical protein
VDHVQVGVQRDAHVGDERDLEGGSFVPVQRKRGAGRGGGGESAGGGFFNDSNRFVNVCASASPLAAREL